MFQRYIQIMNATNYSNNINQPVVANGLCLVCGEEKKTRKHECLNLYMSVNSLPTCSNNYTRYVLYHVGCF
jgi:hypothetical protein